MVGDAHEIDEHRLEGLPPLVRRDAPGASGRRAAAVEDEDVDSAQRLRHVPGEGIDLIHLARVADEGQHVPADPVGRGLRALHGAAGDGDAGALLRQAPGDAEA